MINYQKLSFTYSAFIVRWSHKTNSRNKEGRREGGRKEEGREDQDLILYVVLQLQQERFIDDFDKNATKY